MKQKDISSEEKDPGLGDGWSFYGKVKKYMAHLEKHWDQKEEVRCAPVFRNQGADAGDDSGVRA
jgi:hypothetical protein